MLDSFREEVLQPEALIRRVGIARKAAIADIGAGPGFWTLRLARAAFGGRVTALDIRADYLEATAARARTAGLKNVRTQLVRPDDAGLSPRSVDLVWMSQVDHYLPDRARYFNGVARALRPGGRIVIINYERYRDVDLAAAAAAGLRVVDEWRPSVAFFMIVLSSQR